MKSRIKVVIFILFLLAGCDQIANDGEKPISSSQFWSRIIVDKKPVVSSDVYYKVKVVHCEKIGNTEFYKILAKRGNGIITAALSAHPLEINSDVKITWVDDILESHVQTGLMTDNYWQSVSIPIVE